MGEETPEWATWGNGGFDPRDARVDRKGKPKEVTLNMDNYVDPAAKLVEI